MFPLRLVATGSPMFEHLTPRLLVSHIGLLNRGLRRSSILLNHGNRRSSSSANSPSSPSSKKTLYPERLLIYHAGTGRTVVLGCLKVTTIFIFSFFSLVFAPMHFYAEDQPEWVAFAVALSGTVPMLFVAYISAPFVTYIHFRVPAFARHSKDMLVRYAKTLPKDAELDITMMNVIGKPRVTRVKVKDLYRTKERFGLANFARDTDEINVKRSWWMGNVPRLFGVHETKSRLLNGDVWELIQGGIEKNGQNSMQKNSKSR